MLGAVAVCPFYTYGDEDRIEITRRVFRHYARIEGLTFVGVGSEGAMSRDLFCEENDEARYFEYEQDFDAEKVGAGGSDGLRAKFNWSISQARAFDPDVVYTVGSDDLVAGRHLTSPVDAMLTGIATGPGGGVCFWRYGTDDCFRLEDARIVYPDIRFAGGCLGVRRDLLDLLDWRPYQFTGDEYGLERHVRAEYGPEAIDARFGVPYWSAKCGRVLNGYQLLKQMQQFRIVPVPDIEWIAFKTLWDSLA